jgi:hypothetical protein
LYKRSVDFMVARVEDVTLPPHLRLFAVCTAMESVGKERRLRLFGIAAYREVMLSQGQTVSDKMHPPTPPEAGRWADLSFRRFYDSQADLVAFVDQYVHGEDDVGSGSGAVKAKAKGLKKNLGTKRGPREGRDGVDELPTKSRPVVDPGNTSTWWTSRASRIVESSVRSYQIRRSHRFGSTFPLRTSSSKLPRVTLA